MAEIGHELLVTYYDNGVKDGEYSGRIKGMQEMMEAIDIYFEIPWFEHQNIFGGKQQLSEIFCMYTPDEFVEKCKKWKEFHMSKKGPNLEVGDYVFDNFNKLCVITSITDSYIHVVYPSGKTHKWKKDYKFTKVGSKAPIMIDAINIMKDNEAMMHGE